MNDDMPLCRICNGPIPRKAWMRTTDYRRMIVCSTECLRRKQAKVTASQVWERMWANLARKAGA